MKTQRANKPQSIAKAAQGRSRPEIIIRGSGNVFEDLGFGDESRELKVKAELARQLYNRIKSLSLTQTDAAKRLAISQPDVSKLMNGRHTGYSVQRLIHLLTALKVDVDIIVKPNNTAPRLLGTGSVRVLEAGIAG